MASSVGGGRRGGLLALVRAPGLDEVLCRVLDVGARRVRLALRPDDAHRRGAPLEVVLLDDHHPLRLRARISSRREGEVDARWIGQSDALARLLATLDERWLLTA